MDARVVVSRMMLRKALLECMKTKTVNSITVKEVCEKAKLNRGTFYKHYKDCYDLLQQIINEEMEEVSQAMRESPSFSLELTEKILAIYDRNADLHTALNLTNGNIELSARMVNVARDFCLERWKKLLTKASEEEIAVLFDYSAAGFLRIIMDAEPGKSRDSKIRFAHQLLERTIEPYK